MTDVKELAKWLEEEVEFLKNNEDYVGGWYELTNGLAVTVLWEQGWGDEVRDDAIQSSTNPDWALCAGIFVCNKHDTPDGWFMPWDSKTGDIICETTGIVPNEDYEKLAGWLLDDYNAIKDCEIKSNGEVIDFDGYDTKILSMGDKEVPPTEEPAVEEESLKEDNDDKALIRTVNSCVDASDLASELEAQGIKYEFADNGVFVSKEDKDRANAILMDMESECDESLKEGKNPKSMADDELTKSYADARKQLGDIMKKNPNSNFAKDLQKRIQKLQYEIKNRGLKVESCDDKSLKEDHEVNTDRAVDYWANEVLFQLDEVYGDNEKVANMSSQDKNDMAVDIAEKIINDDYIWEHVNESIDWYINEALGLDEACKNKKCHKSLKETWAGEDVIDDIVDRAQSMINGGDYEYPEDAVRQAIDDGLIYTKDIYDLVEHYGSIDTGDMIESFYDFLYDDVMSRVEIPGDSDEDAEVEEESLKESVSKKSRKSLKESKKKLNEDKEYSTSPYKDIIAEYFEYDGDFEFLDVVASIIGRVDNFEDDEDIWTSIDDELIYFYDQWKVLEHYCTPQDADWEVAFESLTGDIFAICATIANKNHNTDKDIDVEETEVEIEDEEE